MTRTVKRWGNSLAVRIPHQLARALGLSEGSTVDLRLEDRRMIIEPLPSPPTLDQLLAGASVKLRAKWTPGRGDVVSVKVVAGRRPVALVLSPAAYSARTGWALVCPIGDAADCFTVKVPSGLPVRGEIHADRVIALDVRAAGMRLDCTCSEEVVTAVLERVAVLVGQ